MQNFRKVGALRHEANTRKNGDEPIAILTFEFPA
jgi:hypothetical protein